MKSVVHTASVLICLAAAAYTVSTNDRATQPLCPRPFITLPSTCHCGRTLDGISTVICGCENFPENREVFITAGLLPEIATAGVQLTITGCRRNVSLRADFITNADRFGHVILEVTDTNQLTWEQVTVSGEEATLHDLSTMVAQFERVQLPRVDDTLMAGRRALSAVFSNVQIGEIATGAFETGSGSSSGGGDATIDVTIRTSRIDHIYYGAFSLPVSSSPSAAAAATPAATSHVTLEDSIVREWASGGYIGGGGQLTVTGSTIGLLSSHAVSLTTLSQLRWTDSTITSGQPAAVHQPSTPPPAKAAASISRQLNFSANTFAFAPAPASGTSIGMLHFPGGVPTELQFTGNRLVGESNAPPVTPDPRPQQVDGTQVRCKACRPLTAWLPGSVFEQGTFCSVHSDDHGSNADKKISARKQQRAIDFLKESCTVSSRMRSMSMGGGGGEGGGGGGSSGGKSSQATTVQRAAAVLPVMLVWANHALLL